MVNKEWKIVKSKQVKKKMKTLSKKDQKKLNKEFKKLVDSCKKGNPPGKPLVAVSITNMPFEVCQKCKSPLNIIYDKNSKEVYFNCSNAKCLENFWVTKKELIEGRKKVVVKFTLAEMQG